MGDAFIIYDENVELIDISHSFNKSHPCLDFTLENEADRSITFLDVLLTRIDESLKMSVYRKSIEWPSDRLL